MAIQEIRGTIKLDDGTTSEFSLSADGYSQWGATTERLGKTVDALTSMQAAVVDEFDWVDDDEEDGVNSFGI
jgi:hypothetical protein